MTMIDEQEDCPVPSAPHRTTAGYVYLADQMAGHNVHEVDAHVVQVHGLLGDLPVARVTVPVGSNIAMPIDFEYPDDLHTFIQRLQAAEDRLRAVRKAAVTPR